MNCAAIPSELIESELFGHMKGSFTGAVPDRAGKFEQADGGTLFLDEVGDMSLAAQAKVLRVLQDGDVTRIGGAEVADGGRARGRGDEQDARGRDRRRPVPRGPVLPAERRARSHVPPLRERREDIPLLVAALHATSSPGTRAWRRAASTHEAVERLSALDWPGNVRELRNTIERLLILAAGPRITAADVDRLGGARAAERSGLGRRSRRARTFEEFKQAAERAFLLAKLREHDWNVSETARALDMPRSNLYKKIERYGLARERS